MSSVLPQCLRNYLCTHPAMCGLQVFTRASKAFRLEFRGGRMGGGGILQHQWMKPDQILRRLMPRRPEDICLVQGASQSGMPGKGNGLHGTPNHKQPAVAINKRFADPWLHSPSLPPPAVVLACAPERNRPATMSRCAQFGEWSGDCSGP